MLFIKMLKEINIIEIKSTVMRIVSKESNTGFRFCSKVNTTYQGLLRATSILTLRHKLSPQELGRGFLLNFFSGNIELRYWNFFRYSVILKI
jgi:hypothetical protein